MQVNRCYSIWVAPICTLNCMSFYRKETHFHAVSFNLAQFPFLFRQLVGNKWSILPALGRQSQRAAGGCEFSLSLSFSYSVFRLSPLVMVNYNAKIVKTENGTNASIIVTADSGNATQPMKTTTTTEMTAMATTTATALSTSLDDLSDQENGTTGKCDSYFPLTP